LEAIDAYFCIIIFGCMVLFMFFSLILTLCYLFVLLHRLLLHVALFEILILYWLLKFMLFFELFVKFAACVEVIYGAFLYVSKCAMVSKTHGSNVSITTRVCSCGNYVKLVSYFLKAVLFRNNWTTCSQWSTVYSIISMRFTMCFWSYDVLHVSWSWHKTTSAPSEIISNRVCGIWHGIGEGANVIIST